MGAPIAKNLIESGFEVKLFNRTPEKIKPLLAIGGKAVSTIQEAADADVIMTILSDDAAVTDVVNRIAQHIPTNSVFLSLSTIKAETAGMLAQALKSREVEYIASPVMGRPPAAAARQLSLLTSGHAATREKLAPIFQAIGQRTFDFGNDPAIAHTVKLMLNFMIFGVVEMLSEVMLMAEKTGIDKNVLLDTMLNTIYGAPVFKNYGNLIVKEEDAPGFATALADKDLRLAQETAAQVGIKLPLAELVRSHFKSIIEQGHGQQDLSLLIRHLRADALSKK